MVDNAIEQMIGDAEREDFFSKLGVGDPRPGEPMEIGKEKVKPGAWMPDELGLPANCPVIPLGVDNDEYFFLDTIGQLRIFAANTFSQKTITSLFMGRHFFLYWAWPRFKAVGDGEFEVSGWRAELATEDLMMACARKGPWNAIDAMRGRGAWRGPDGELIVHCGNSLIANGKRLGLGESGGAVYATRPPLPRPWPQPIDPEREGPAVSLLTLLRTWNWRRPEIDPLLFLGWIVAAFLGGALGWRPIIFITGDKATGKSTLQLLLKSVMGKWLIQAGDTTAAGIYQQLHFDSLPVAVDEMEGKADNRKALALLELARLAASGMLMFRGGESHTGIQFNARSSFAFSSINTPPLEPQDLSRMGLLQLRKLPEGAAQPSIDEAQMGRLGRQLLRRATDNWDRFPATLKAYRQALAQAGHDGRGQDTFGTLLACADLVIDADADALGLKMGEDARSLDYWTIRMRAKGMTEYENQNENWRACLDMLLTKPVEGWKHNTYKTVGQLLEKLHLKRGRGEELTHSGARELLNETGLTLQFQKRDPSDVNELSLPCLVIPNDHPSLAALFRGTKWEGAPGAGVWRGALAQAPESILRDGQCKIHGKMSRATLFALDDIITKDEEAAHEQPEAALSF